MIKIRSSLKVRISFALIVSMLMAMFLPTVRIQAAAVNYYNHIYGIRYVKPSGYDYDSYIPQITVDGQYGFCLDIDKVVARSSNYVGSELLRSDRELLARIAYYGWYQNQSAYNYAVVQSIIWEYIHGGTVPYFYQGNSPFYNNANQVARYRESKAAIMALVNAYDTKPSFNDETIALKPGDSITLTDNNNALSKMVLRTNTTGLDVQINGNSVTLTADINAQSGKIMFAKAVEAYEGVPIIYRLAGYQDVGVLRVTDPGWGGINIKIVQHGKIEFTKTNPPSVPLSEARFSLLDAGGYPVTFYKTGEGVYLHSKEADATHTLLELHSSGKLILEGLGEGTYQIKEVSHPNGTLISDNVTATVVAGETTKVSMSNRSQPLKIRVLKTDMSNKPLADAIFEISGNSITPFRIRTGADGTATTANRTPGTYTVKEVVPPPGYLISEPAEQTVTLIGDKSNKELIFTKTFKNSSQPLHIKIVKNNEEGKGLADAVFKISGNGITPFFIRTGADGTATTANRTAGTYTIEEITPPPGYELSEPATKTVTIAGNQSNEARFFTTTFINTSQPMKIKVIKTDTESKPLADAVFEISGNGITPFFIRTGADGSAITGNRTPGIYKVTEMIPPKGYTLSNPNFQMVEVKADQSGKELIFTKTFVNEKASPLKIKIVKEDPNGKALADAVFEVSGNGITPFRIKTLEDGSATTHALKPGIYTVTEIFPPKGYLLSDPVSQEITIEAGTGEDELLFTVRFENAAQPLRIRAIKAGEDKRGLEGAVFTVSGNGIVPFDITTTANGSVTTKDLPEGTYTITEKTAPVGYVLDTTPGTITLTSDQSNTIKTFSYTKVDKAQVFDLKLYKQDLETGKTPQGEATFVGASFEVRLLKPFLRPAEGEPNAGDVIGTIVTNENGYGELLNLPLGQYEVIETKAPEGYVVNPNPIIVDALYDKAAGEKSQNISYSTNDAALVIENDAALARLEILLNEIGIRPVTLERTTVGLEATPIGSAVYADSVISGRFEILKYKNVDEQQEEATEVPEAGVSFEVIDKNGNIVDHLTTNKNGVALSQYLPYGSYTLRQTYSPDDVNPVADQKITISKHREVKTYKLVNIPNFMRLRITKLDANTKKPILKPGATFEIYNSKDELMKMRVKETGEIVNQFSLGAEGYTDTFGRLPQGKYTLKEVTAPEGYYLPKDMIVGFEIPKLAPSDGDLSVKIEVEGKEETLIHQPVENQAQTGTLSIDKRAEIFKGWVTGTVKEIVQVDASKLSASTIRVDAGRRLILERLDLKTEVTESTRATITSSDSKEAVTPVESQVSEKSQASEAAALETEAYIEETVGTAAEEITVETVATSEVTTIETEMSEASEATETAVSEAIMPVLTEALVIEEVPLEILPEEGGSIMGGGGLPKWNLISDKEGKVTKHSLLPGLYLLKDIDGTEITRQEVSADGIFSYMLAPLTEMSETIVEANNEKEESFTVHTPTWEEASLAGVSFELRAASDILSMDNQTILHKKGEVVISGTTTGACLTFTDIPLGDYLLVETKTVNGYLLDSTERPISFTPAASHIEIVTKEAKLINKRQVLSATMTKTMKETPYFQHEVGALSKVLFGVYNAQDILGLSANSLIALVRPDNTGKMIVRDIPEGSYYFKELFTDQNYQLDERNFDFSVAYSGVGEDVVNETGLEAVNEPETTELELIKVDVETGKALPGAKFSLTAIKNDGTRIPILNNEGESVFVTDDNGKIYWIGLENGNYVIIEIAAPDGYYTDKTPIQVVLDADLDRKVTITASNKPTELTVVKVDLEKQGLVPGAKLELVDKNGNVKDSWVSTEEPHTVKYLTLGETYLIREVEAPKGYVNPSKHTEVTINDDPSGTDVSLPNDYTKVEISKKDASTGKELAGASMRVTDQDGNVVDEWISTDTPHLITKLEVGKTYTLHEDLAPLGYAVASNIIFTVENTGVVQKVEMFDEITEVIIEKNDATDGKAVAGAKIEVFDEDGKKVFEGYTDEDGKIRITGLEAGKTYTFKETIHPFGYTLNKNTFTFTINLDGTVEGQTKFSDEPTRFEIKKTDAAGKELAGVGFQLFTDTGVKITWSLKDGIYIADANGTLDTITTSQHGDIFMQYLPVGKYKLRETVTPKGYIVMRDMDINLTDNHGTSSPLQVTIKNETVPSVPVLPRTGEVARDGIAIGGFIVVLAAVLSVLIRRRRKEKKYDATLQK